MEAASDSPANGETVILDTDDLILPFQVSRLGILGRVVRLGNVVTEIVERHDYPEPVTRLLAEAIALTAMLGAAIKFEGKLSLQTKSKGPCDMFVVDYTSGGTIRAYAHYNADAIKNLGTSSQDISTAQLLGDGHLAITIDQGPNTERYQGIVPLSNTSLSEAAHTYFNQSEQIPTNIYLAAGPVISASSQGPVSGWRAGGMMIQHLPDLGGNTPQNDLPPGDLPEGAEAAETTEDDRWTRARALMNTLEDHELLDPTVSLERLIYRFFHEDGVHVFPATALKRGCQCSAESVEVMLGQFTTDDIENMIENGEIGVTCEFCSEKYVFDPAKFLPQQA